MKKKIELLMKLTSDEPSERKEAPQIFVAMAELITIHDTNIDLGNSFHMKGKSSKIAQNSQILFPIAEPTMTKNVLMSKINNGIS